jgi:hypothetical protein
MIHQNSAKLSVRGIFQAESLLQNYSKKPLDLQRCTQLNCISMDAKEYERIKRDIDKRLEEAQIRHQKESDALEMVWSLERGKQPEVDLLDSVTWADMVRKVITMVREPFTRYEVEQAVLQQFPGAKQKFRKNSMGGILTRMQERGEIQVVEAGSGPRPAKYRLQKRTKD